MSADREIANAISDGINCIAEIASALSAVERDSNDVPSSPDPRWSKSLDAMERAFNAVLARQVITSLVVHGEDVGRIQGLSVLVSEWLIHGRASEELKPLAEATLSSFGLPLESADPVTP
jgi:hypothetical protein